MQTVYSMLRSLGQAFNQFANNMDPTAWAAVAVVAVILGFFFLRGNVIRST